MGALVEMKKFVTLNIKVSKKEKRNIYIKMRLFPCIYNRKLTIYLIYYAYAEYLFSFRLKIYTKATNICSLKVYSTKQIDLWSLYSTLKVIMWSFRSHKEKKKLYPSNANPWIKPSDIFEIILLTSSSKAKTPT